MNIAKLLIAAQLLLPTPGSAELYRWVDDQGKTHFSDRPVEHAKSVQVPKTNSFNGHAANKANTRASEHLRKGLPRRHPQNHYTPPSTHIPKGPTNKEIERRIADCKRRRNLVGCNEKRARREYADEQYRKSGYGKWQQMDIRSRQNGH
ncbi:MAG: DUF4124 domain-containing protein [Alcanivorax sp.]|nr:DUF4124 domain-containing protein [Alcanivorax sp.]